MKYCIKTFLLVFTLLAFWQCSDDEVEETEISSCSLIIASGTSFTLYSTKNDFLKSIVFENDKTMSGTKTKYLKSGDVVYSLKGLKLNLEGYVELNDIIFTQKGDKLSWLHSPDGKCAYFGESYEIQLDELEYIKTLNFQEGKKANYMFGESNDNYMININGTFFIE